jgi:hypothetical protein
LGEVEDRSSRARGDGGRLAVSVKLAVAAVTHARERKRREEVDAGFKYELVASQQMA